ncbi:MAG: hypothetical protein KGQ59_06445 [Bdellovibrionales bacterium]|nr:hypothetical protein [Bdellovibrionales bacterium]
MNYWEFRPTVLVERLDQLIQRGVSEIVSFVPWQAVEADISHLLSKFLQAAADRNISVSLVVSPELAIAYPNSGIPRDVLQKPECLALDADGQPLVVISAPNSHALPSILSAEFLKRHQSYLQRVDHYLHDAVKRGGAHVLHRVRLILTGSFWKYYRTPRHSVFSAFDGPSGEFTPASLIQLRNRIEQRFSEQEFCEPTAASSNRWKTKSMEEINRRWFMQQSEEQFRSRAAQFFNRKSLSVSLEQVELYTPEVDPSFHYSRTMSLISGAKADFSRLADLVDEAGQRHSQVSGDAVGSWLHWSGSGAFASLSTQERQFLILKSLLLLGAQSGGVLIDAEEWFSLSESFRRRTETLARSLAQGEYRLRQRACYWNSHLWSSGGNLWSELSGRLGSLSQMIASDQYLQSEAAGEIDLLLVDPTVIFTGLQLTRILSWTRAGRVTAIPRSLLYTEKARHELQRILSGDLRTERLDLHVGLPFELHVMGQGKLVVYDAHALEKSDSPEVARQFIQALMGLAEIRNPCAMSDERLQVIGLERQSGGRGIFILNPYQKVLASELVFSNEVVIEDLAHQLEGASLDDREDFKAQRFHLEIPPCGVLPLQVMDARWKSDLEQREASRRPELPSGFADGSNAEEFLSDAPGSRPWN